MVKKTPKNFLDIFGFRKLAANREPGPPHWILHSTRLKSCPLSLHAGLQGKVGCLYMDNNNYSVVQNNTTCLVSLNAFCSESNSETEACKAKRVGQ